jgi:hypothetical protein
MAWVGSANMRENRNILRNVPIFWWIMLATAHYRGKGSVIGL